MTAYRIVALLFVGALMGIAVRTYTDTNDTASGELAIARELHCEEDEEIIIALGVNGLPYGYCDQVIEKCFASRWAKAHWTLSDSSRHLTGRA